MEESCNGLHLICDKVLGSTPDFYVSHRYTRSILALKINVKNKQFFYESQTSYLLQSL